MPRCETQPVSCLEFQGIFLRYIYSSSGSGSSHSVMPDSLQPHGL